jgi:serine/threonine protein kinase
VLLDFGVAADAFAGVRETADVFVGTIAYMAPERRAGGESGLAPRRRDARR